MCQNHTGNTITQEDLNALAALAGYTLPTPAQLEGTVLPQGWSIVPGEIPAPYEAELYAGISDAEGGEGTRRRSTTGENGRSRNLVFPPAPEPLPHRGQPHPHGPARRRGRNQCPRRARCR